MKVGDKIVIRSNKESDKPKEYTIIEIDGRWIKAKHPDIAGYFCFTEESIVEVINESR